MFTDSPILSRVWSNSADTREAGCLLKASPFFLMKCFPPQEAASPLPGPPCTAAFSSENACDAHCNQGQTAN